MADDLLGDILRQTTGESLPRPAPASGSLGDVIAQAVARPARPAASTSAPDLAALAALDAAGAAAFLRYLPADLVIPLLAHAPVAVQTKLVGAMDADARAWLGSQNDEIEAVGPAKHASAAVKALNLLQKLREDGRLDPAPAAAAVPVAAPAPPKRPVQVSASFGDAGSAATVISESAPAAGGQRPVASDQRPAASDATADPTVDLLTALVDAARGRRPGELRQLADGLDHPVLAQGLRLVAEGVDPHDLDAALRAAIADHLEAETRRQDLMRRAVMAIRFGDSADAFRASVR